MTDNINGTQPTGSPDTQPGQQIATPTPQANEVPTWLPKRLEDERDAERRRVLKEFGLDKFDDLKTLIEFGKQAKQAALTESEKSAAAVKEAELKVTNEATARQAAEARVTELEAARLADRVDGAIRAVAQTLGAKKADKVLALLRVQNPAKVAALANGKGEIDAKATESLVAEFRTANPEDFAGGGPGSPSILANARTPDPKSAIETANKGRKLFSI